MPGVFFFSRKTHSPGRRWYITSKREKRAIKESRAREEKVVAAVSDSSRDRVGPAGNSRSSRNNGLSGPVHPCATCAIPFSSRLPPFLSPREISFRSNAPFFSSSVAFRFPPPTQLPPYLPLSPFFIFFIQNAIHFPIATTRDLIKAGGAKSSAENSKFPPRRRHSEKRSLSQSSTYAG